MASDARDVDQTKPLLSVTAGDSRAAKVLISSDLPEVHEYPAGSDITRTFKTVDRLRFITPRDEYSQVYLSFILLGAGFLMPWDAMITTQSYFTHRLGDAKVFFYMTAAYMTPNLIGLVALVKWGHKMTFGRRIVPGFVSFLVVLAIVCFVKNEYVALGVTALLGFSDAVTQGSVYGLAGQFHPRFVGAVMAGNGWAGIVISAMQMIILVAVPSADDRHMELSTPIFFGVTGVCLLLCIFLYVVIVARSPVTRYYLNKSADERTKFLTGGASLHSSHDPLPIFRQIWPTCLMVALNFLLTLFLYPALPLLIEPVNKAFWDGSRIPFLVVLVAIFNAFDLLGRSLCRFEALIVFNRRTLWLPTLLRFGFAPFFLLAVTGGGADGHAPMFRSDTAVFVGMGAFALSNGYIGTLCMMFSADEVEPEFKETAGVIAVFFLTVGLTAGVWGANLIPLILA